MIKRRNKIIALLVAATSVMSIVPAMAATKLGTKDGTIENAAAYKDGKYLYKGYRTDDDESALYYNDGTKDKKLDDATEFDTGKYKKDEVSAKDGNDEYVIDLTNGKVSDDDTVGDSSETAENKLQNKLRKTDRYGNENATIVHFEQIQNSKNRFGDIWYAYSATTTSAGITASWETTSASATAMIYAGYTNESGSNYIDCSHKANIYVFNGSKMVKLEELGDQDTDGSNHVKLTKIQYIKTLGQDDKYLYRLILVHVDGAKAVGASGTADEDLYYVQKISKAQGDKEKDAYLPKSTESFQIGSKTLDGDKMGDSDVKDAFNTLIKDSDSASGFTYIVDGSIYSTYLDGEKVKTVRLDLKTSKKLEVNGTSSNKVDGHVVVKNGDKDQKVEDDGQSDLTAIDGASFTVDVNGNVWAIKDGEILESTKIGDFKVVYTTDRSFNRIDVYDENNLIAWKNGGDAYTNVQEGKKQSADENQTAVTPAKTGWDQLADGNWNYYDASGNKVVNNWQQVGSDWYYFDAYGAMTTGWLQSGSDWYYLNPVSDGTKGSMKTGWQYIDGNWYYLNPISDGTRGAMKTGWQQVGGLWYYLNPVSDGTKGAMKTGWIYVNSNWYYMYSSGAMAADTTIQGYRLSSSGALI